MKKYLVLFFLMSSVMHVLQAQADIHHHQHYYGELQGSSKAFSTSLAVTFHYGDNAAISEWAKVYQYDYNMRSFSTMMDAMNFLSAQGWELVDTYQTSDQANEHSRVHWVVRIDSAKLTQSKKKE